ncbi:MAG: SDR family NAD(P)-dependent oxidoreductase [Anaerolineales bacterium]|jgi:NAD(P)-dependent dehydrogenase (short-subunit alcohol dehydrogenase family)
MDRLKGKVAIITGGGRGIGRAIANGFAAEGATVVIAARTQNEIETVASEIAAKDGQACAHVTDVSDEDSVKQLIGVTQERYGSIDILVNNAGVGNIRPVYGIPKKSFESVLAVNLIGTFLCTKHVWRPMKANHGGSIINVSSIGGLRGFPYLSAYCASKWGQIGFTKAAAEEGKEDHIRVNAIAPGKADTDFRAQIRENKDEMLQPEDHVGVCVFLASDESIYITGEVIPLEWYGSNDS